jgi:hypothetical protein
LNDLSSTDRSRTEPVIALRLIELDLHDLNTLTGNNGPMDAACEGTGSSKVERRSEEAPPHVDWPTAVTGPLTQSRPGPAAT